jgi:hypothetical protein
VKTEALLAFVFDRIAKLPVDGTVRCTVLVDVATMPWRPFGTPLRNAATARWAYSNLVFVNCFGRLTIPLWPGPH